MRALVLALLLTGCGASGLTVANYAGLGAQTSALACDWGQTRRAASMDWRIGEQRLGETNPMLGQFPSERDVDLYFIGAIGLSALAWYIMPKRWKWTVPVAVMAIQADAIANNLGGGGVDLGVCGFGNASVE